MPSSSDVLRGMLHSLTALAARIALCCSVFLFLAAFHQSVLKRENRRQFTIPELLCARQRKDTSSSPARSVEADENFAALTKLVSRSSRELSSSPPQGGRSDDFSNRKVALAEWMLHQEKTNQGGQSPQQNRNAPIDKALTAEVSAEFSTPPSRSRKDAAADSVDSRGGEGKEALQLVVELKLLLRQLAGSQPSEDHLQKVVERSGVPSMWRLLVSGDEQDPKAINEELRKTLVACKSMRQQDVAAALYEYVQAAGARIDADTWHLYSDVMPIKIGSDAT